MDELKVFVQVLERKEAFLNYNNIHLKKPKVYISWTELGHNFCQKIHIFPSYNLIQNNLMQNGF